MLELLLVIFIGWSLGGNDAANVFGNAVANRVIKFRTAAITASVFVVLGAVIGGGKGIANYNSFVIVKSDNTSMIIIFSAAIIVTIMTYLKIPVSVTHTIIAGIAAAGLKNGAFKTEPLVPIVISWVLSPVGAAFLSYFLYRMFLAYVKKYINNIEKMENFVKYGFMIIGIYGSYSLGANNIANVVGIFAHDKRLSINEWAFVGSLAIALGIVTFSRRVMDSVGKDITQMTNIGALIAVAASSTIVLIYSFAGIPVSTSQAIVGGVIGVGLSEGIRNMKVSVILKIISGWVYSLLFSGIGTYLLLCILGG